MVNVSSHRSPSGVRDIVEIGGRDGATFLPHLPYLASCRASYGVRGETFHSRPGFFLDARRRHRSSATSRLFRRAQETCSGRPPSPAEEELMSFALPSVWRVHDRPRRSRAELCCGSYFGMRPALHSAWIVTRHAWHSATFPTTTAQTMSRFQQFRLIAVDRQVYRQRPSRQRVVSRVRMSKSRPRTLVTDVLENLIIRAANLIRHDRKIDWALAGVVSISPGRLRIKTMLVALAS